jgi:hypothetical protein
VTDEFADDGYDSPEEAARGDIPEQYATVVGIQIDGDSAALGYVD